MWSAAHVHLTFNHFPITGGMMVLALLAWGWLRRNDALIRAACGLFILVTLLTVVTYLSGEPAEHVLQRAGNFTRESRALAGEHEEVAEFALILYSVLGVASLFTLLRYARRAVPRVLSTVVLVLALAAVGTAAWVGWLGGPIKHTEVRSGAVLAPDSAGGQERDED